MSVLESWIHTPAASALGKTLVHSLWEGAAVALLLGLALCFLRSSRARYAAACLAMVGLLGIFAFTFTRVMPQPRFDGGAPARLPGILPAVEGSGLAVGYVPRQMADYVPWLAPFWIAGVLIFHLRSLTTWIAASRLRRTGVCSAPDPWQGRLDRLRARVQVSRPVRLLESCLADVPVVIGHLRPVILMPVGLLAGLPVGQVEAILLHELAHIRRFDYLANLLQLLVESLLFYHPAAWWVSSVIRAERENCCDDLVVAVQGGAYEYAHALAALEMNRGPRQALAATGGNLVKRIRRLLAQPEQRPAALAPVAAAAILTVTAMTAMAWQSKPAERLPAAAPAAAVETPTPQQPVKLLAQVQRPPEPVRKQGAVREAGAPVLPDAEPVTPYRKWMNEDVTYILTDNERQAFKQLTTDEERDKFIERFWLARDPNASTVTNEFKEEYYRRIAYANERFAGRIPGWKTDRGRIYIMYGPADEIEAHPSGGPYQRPAAQGGGTTSTFPFEQWRYKYIEGIGTDVIIEFVDAERNGEYRQSLDPTEKDILRATGQTINGNHFWAKTWQLQSAGKFYVLGEVVRPGAYSPTARVTVLQALVTAGGFRATANTKEIIVQRGTLRMTFNYDEVFRGINPAQNILLMPGDHIIVR